MLSRNSVLWCRPETLVSTFSTNPNSQVTMVYRHGAISAGVATLLGATLGGFLVWRALQTRRKKLPRGPSLPHELKAADPMEHLGLVEPEATIVECQPQLLEQLPSVEPLPNAEPPTATQPPTVALPPTAEQLLGVKPVMVTSEEEWQQVWPLLRKDLDIFPVLGLDCEWVSVKRKASPVSLLQIASYTGRCILVRLLLLQEGQPTLPLSLADVLRDTHVLKVGVGAYEDGKRLNRDHGLSLKCTVDLRHLVLKLKPVLVSTNGLSLQSLAADLLEVSLDKSLELRCSNWEACQLTPEQITYAARDAQISVALFFHLLGLDSEVHCSADNEGPYDRLASWCQGLLDRPFGRRPKVNGETVGKPTYKSPESGDQEDAVPRRNKRKGTLIGPRQQAGGYLARKMPLYDNCFLQAPDGQPLCTCDKKKAKWYLDKGIGELVSEQPYTVRLLFEPSGRPDSQHDYYLTAKMNLCVVCGKEESYIRKNIVPHEYRRHFPQEMKDHNSHDILLLCLNCHMSSVSNDFSLKERLAAGCRADGALRQDGAPRQVEDPDRRRVRSAARALLKAGDLLPELRRSELQAYIRDFYGEEGLSPDMLQEASTLEIRTYNDGYVSHGLKVVRAHAEEGPEGLMKLERCWREHFLNTMSPRHMPALWSVDHNHEKFRRMYKGEIPFQLSPD